MADLDILQTKLSKIEDKKLCMYTLDFPDQCNYVVYRTSFKYCTYDYIALTQGYDFHVIIFVILSFYIQY